MAFREHHVAPSKGRPSRFGGHEWNLLAATWVVLLPATSTTVPQFKPPSPLEWTIAVLLAVLPACLLPTALPPLPTHTPRLSTLPTAAVESHRSDSINHLSPALHSFPCPTQSRSQSPYGNPQGPTRSPALCHLARWLSLKHNTHTRTCVCTCCSLSLEYSFPAVCGFLPGFLQVLLKRHSLEGASLTPRGS